MRKKLLCLSNILVITARVPVQKTVSLHLTTLRT